MAKISTYPILSDPTINDILIGTDVEDSNITKNFSIGSIVDIVGDEFVPYVGATGNVNLGAFNITSTSFIVAGGLASQFLKANGTLDSTVYVPASRTLTINGVTFDLSANRSWDLNTIDTLTTIGTSGPATYIGKTLNIPQYQAQGNYITQLSGEATAVGPGNATVTLSNLAVISKILTGLNITGGTVTDTDSILTAFGKVQNQINGLAGGVTYQGTWNAATNVPFLQSSVGTKGFYYVVSVPGNTNLNGVTDWKLGDWAIFNGSAWEKVDNTDAVVSVNGYTGAVVLTFSDVGAPPATRTLTINGTEFDLTANRSWTVGDVRTDQTYSNPTWISSLAWGKITGTPTTLAGYGITDGVSSSRTLTINGVTFDLTANRSWNVGTVTSVGTSGPLTGGTITGSGTIGITQSGASSDGYLSSTDWNTFNNKQNALTNPVTGTGTIFTLPMWSGATSLVNSPLSYGPDAFNFQYNSATGGTVNFTNIGLTAYTYAIQMNNFGSPRSTVHSYTDGVVVQSIGGTQVSRMFANGNFILGTGVVDNGYKLEVSGNLYLNSIVNATTDTDRFIVSDGGVIKYRTGAQLLSDIGAQGALTLTTTGTSGAATLISNVLNIPQYTDQFVGTVTSVGLSMPPAFTVSNSPVTSAGTLTVVGAGNATQYVRGDGALATLPTSGTGGGASVSYYLNGSVNQGTIGGVTYYEMNRTPIIGTGTDFTINTNGYIASFLTDAGDPALLAIPAGNWNFETYFSASSGGGSPTFYLELYKYDGTTFTLIASNSGSPKLINDGTSIEAYFSALAVPQTTLTLTDRLAIRIYVTASGRTITLHTENGHLCQVITTFTTGLTALNGLTSQVQYFATGTAGTNFNILSAVDTHTFNLPTASAVNRGALSSADWTTFNNKQATISLTTTGSSGSSTFISNVLNVPTYTLAGLGGVPTSRTITINGTTQDLSADRTYSVGTVTSVAALTLGTSGTDLSSSVANGTTTPVITLNVPTASATNRGALSAADWSTFNSKQNALTNPVTGTGTAGQVAYFNGTSSITGEANLFWDSTNDRLGIGVTPTQALDVVGKIKATDDLVLAQQNPAISFDNGVSGTLRIFSSFASAAIATFNSTGVFRLNQYGTGARTGTRAYDLAVDSSGNVIEVAVGAGTVTGSGTSGQVTFWNGSSSITSESNFLWNASTNKLTVDNGSVDFRGLQQDAAQVIMTLGALNAAGLAKNLYVTLTAGGTPEWKITTGAAGTDAGVKIIPDGSSGLTVPFGIGASSFSHSLTIGDNLTVNDNAAIGGPIGTEQLFVYNSMAKLPSSIGWGIVVQDTNTDGIAGRGGAIAFGAYRTDSGRFNAAAVAGAKSNSTGGDENGDLVLYSSVASSLTERVRVLSSGRTLMGPTMPTDDGTSALQVSGGNIRANEQVVTYRRFVARFNSTGNLCAEVYEDGASTNGGTLALYGLASGTVDTVISAAPTKLNFINNAANVMIGWNTDQGYKLAVNGSGYFSGNLNIGSIDTIVTIGGVTNANTEGKIVLRTGSTKIGWSLAAQSLVDNAFTIAPSTTAGGTTFTTPIFTLASTGAATFSNLSGSGTRMVVADANGLLSTQAIGSGAITGSGTTNYLPKFTGSSTIGNSAFYDGGGFGGFNSTGLGVRTFVINAASGRPLVFEMIEFANIHAVYVRPNNSGFNLISSNYISGGVYLPLSLSGRENNADLVLQTSGNVTIGTTTDSGYKFDVNGTGRFSGALTANGGISSTGLSVTSGGAGISLTGTVGSNSYYVMDQTPNSGKRWRFGHTGAIGGFSSFDIYNQTDNITPLTLASTGAATFSSTIRSNNTYGLGIGDIAGYRRIQYDNSVTRFGFITDANSLADIEARKAFFSTTGAVDSTTALLANASTNDSTTYAAIFGSLNAGYRMVVRADGNVGIGTTTPSYKLDIVNSVPAPTSLEPITLRLFNGSDGGSAIYFQNTVGGQSKISFGVESSGSGTDDTYLGFSTGANTALTERMRISSTGNVGIGTTNLPFTLNIESTSEAALRVKSTNASGAARLILNPEGAGAGSTGDASIFFDCNSTAWVTGVDKSDSSKYKIAVDPYGDFRAGVHLSIDNVTDRSNVVVGGNTALATAANRGSLTINGTSTSILSYGTGGTLRGYLYCSGTDFVMNHGAGSYTFESNTATAMVISSGGGVGIRTTPGALQLAVNGSNNGIDFETNNTSTSATSIFYTIRESGVSRTITTGGYSYGSSNPLTMILTQNSNTPLGMFYAADNAEGAGLKGFKSRGTVAAPVSVNNGDTIFSMEGWAFHGSGPNQAKFGAGMRFVKDDNYGSANTYAPQRTEFYNADTTTTLRTNMIIYPTGLTAMAINGGNVLIGTTTDVGGRLGVKSSGTNTSPFVIQRSANTNTLAAISETSAGDASFFLTNASGSTNIQLLSNGNSILNGGNVLIGTASDAGYTLNVVGNAQFIKSSTSTAMVVGLSGVTGSIIRFSYNGGFVGSISTDGSTTAYNTSSDYRLKEQVRPIDNPLEKVMKLNPVNFKYKNSNTRQDGFIAHEIQEILPYLVTGEKDGVEMQEVDYSKLTPILIAAIKELKQEIDKLKNK